jgi:hypothetical protein
MRFLILLALAPLLHAAEHSIKPGDNPQAVMDRAAAELYVAPTGNNANPGTKVRPLATIQAGVDILQPSVTLLVHGGVHREPVPFPRSGTAEKPITVKAHRVEKVEHLEGRDAMAARLVAPP